MPESSEPSVSGTWFGNYYYHDASQANAFEAVFVQAGPNVSGSILDEGTLGEAKVAGSFAGGQIKFRKVYFNSTNHPVDYEGKLSDDGKSLSGTWRITNNCRGSWIAWRMDGEEKFESVDTEIECEQEQAKPLVSTRTM